jgi:Dolichyl-phosphate-mannose-protein mannosyltransferase
MTQRLKRLFAYPGFIAVFAFAARMAILCAVWYAAKIPARYYVPYGFELGRVASSIASGKGFSSPLRLVDTGATAWFTPIYPYLAAGVFKIWGIYSEPSKLILQTLNCVFASLAVIPIYFIAEKCFGKSAAVAAAWVWTFLPTSLYFRMIWIWDTTLAALFMALIFWATLEVRETKSTWAWAGYSALWVTGVLVNPSLLALLPFLAGWALWHSPQRSSSWLKFSAAALLVFTLGLVPWTVRNYIVFGKFIPLRSNFGLELWLGNNPNVADTWSATFHPNDNPIEMQKYVHEGEIAYMTEKQREAFAFMRTHPADTLNFMFHRFVQTWLDESDSPADVWISASLYIRAFLVWNILLALTTFLGALFVYRTRRPESFPLVATPLVFPLIFYLTHSSLRYRFPIDPIIVVLSVYTASFLISLVRRRPAMPAEAEAPVSTI